MRSRNKKTALRFFVTEGDAFVWQIPDFVMPLDQSVIESGASLVRLDYSNISLT